MIVRIWRTELEPGAAADYDAFARTRSLPMFERHAGFAAVLFAREGSTAAVITLWQERCDIVNLERSPLYLDTVRALEATGLLRGSSRVETIELRDYVVRAEALGTRST
jgi:heme-degrading monooxygenase HmoA